MKSRKLALLLTLAIAAQTALAPVSSMSTVFAATTDPAITTDTDDAATDAPESDEEITTSVTETETEENSATESEEQTLSEEDTESTEETSDELTETETETTEEVTTESEELAKKDADKLKEKKAKDKDEAELLGDSMPAGTECDIKVLPKIYNNYNGNGYGFSFAINMNDKTEDFDSAQGMNNADIKVQVDNGSINSINNGYKGAGYTGKYLVLNGGYLDKSLSAGKHTVKVAVKKANEDTWYVGSAETELVYEDKKDQKYEINPEGRDPEGEDYFSAKTGGTIVDFGCNLGSAKTSLNSSGHQFKSVKLVKHGTSTSVADAINIVSGWSGEMNQNHHYDDIIRYPDDGDDSALIEYYLANRMPKDDSLGLWCDFKLTKDIDEGWYDVVAVADSGAKATFTNAYYATNKVVLYGIGCRFPWYYGEIANQNRGEYVAAYIYGLNITEGMYPSYFKEGAQLTENEGYHTEPLFCNNGYSYLLKKNNNDVWNSEYGDLNVSVNLNGVSGDNLIDARDEENKTGNVSIPYSKVYAVGGLWDGEKLYGWSDWDTQYVFYLSEDWIADADSIGIVTYANKTDRDNHENSTSEKEYNIIRDSSECAYIVSEFRESEYSYFSVYRDKDSVRDYWDGDWYDGTFCKSIDLTADMYYGPSAVLSFSESLDFELYDSCGFTKITQGTCAKDKPLDQCIPSSDKYKIRHDTMYRVFIYKNGKLDRKEFISGLSTGQPTADSVTISVEPTEATVGVGGTVKLVPTVGPDVIADKSVTYSSNKKTVATVDAEGTVTGVAPGTAEITVTTKTGGKKAKVKITVIEKIVAVTGITISEQDKEISGVTGDYYPLSYTLAPEGVTETDVEFISNNEEVVKTNAKDGMLYMVGEGEATVTVKITSPSSGETYSATCHVTVAKKPVRATSVSLNCRNVVLKPGDGFFRLYASVNPSNADVKSVTWNYSKNGVISRMTEYPLSAVIYPNYIRGGDAIVWIEHSDGLTAECKVTVLKDEARANGDIKPDDEKHDIWISTIPAQTYTGSKITPEIRVYDGGVMLTKGTDYTVTYANNVNVGSIGATKNGKNIAPRAVVKFKGNYKGIALSRSFDILPLNIEADTESDFFDAPDITIDFKDGKTYKPVPVLKRNGKKLNAGKDFDYVYLNEGNPIDSIKDNNRYTIRIQAKGNYTGEKTIHCDAIGKGGVYVPISSIRVTLNPSTYEYDPAGVTPSYTVTYGDEPVDPKMYTVTYLNDSNSRVGTATMVFKGSGEYDMYEFVGEKRVTFKITGKALDKAVNVEGIVNKTFTGSDIMQDDAKLTLKTDPSKVLEKDKDYTVSYTKNINVGTATVTYKGIGAYTGTLKKTFKINKANADDIEVNVYDVPYTKGGAKTDPSVKYNGRKLTSGKDYTLSYKYNTVVTTEGVRNKPEITIKYKGNFSGQKTYNYKVAGQNINKLNVSVSDKAYSTKAYSWMSAPVITDVNGKKLKAGVDYEKITVGNYDYFGKNWGDNPQPGTRITVTVKGKGNYTGEREVDYHIFSNNISKAKFKIKDRIYAGNYVTLSKEDFTTATLTVKENGKNVTKDLALGTDFAIVSYEKNLKKGTATVYIKGIGGEYDLGGTRKLTFKITAKDSATLSYVEE